MKTFLRAAAIAAISLAVFGIGPANAGEKAVTLGVLNDMSSLYSDATGKGSLVAAQMAVEDFGGKVLGKPIVVLSADHQNKPDVGSNIANKWIDEDGVDAIVDVPTSSVALAVQEITKKKDRVFLMSGPGASDLTGPACSPTGIQYTYDTFALSNVAGKAMVARGDNTWFFITADYAFGHALERDATDIVTKAGGKVLGSVRVPLNTADFSSYLLQAQSSGAKVVALANAGGDTQTAIKQAAEFGLQKSGQKLLALLINITDTHSLGLATAQGMLLTEGFYWDMNDETRAWSKRFLAKVGHMPTMIQAGVYSEVTQYLTAIKASGTDEAKAVVARMRATQINDFFAKNGHIRADGRMVHDMYLMQVKAPAESKGEWDLYKLIATVPGDEAYRPMKGGGCPLVQG
ncbi:MAG TPA: ABC transporter substrate-binding protein [Stellaceae bacterium]|nr:ABC transporter substrate-binding protein [Stellaceae bacterium]